MIAYDLDGVLLPDGNTDIDNFLEIRRDFPRASFIPKDRYVIITGRPVRDYDMTMAWVKRELAENLPIHVFHGNTSLKYPEIYKTMVLDGNALIHAYVESNIQQVEFIQKSIKRPIPIVHFASLIQKNIEKLDKFK